MESDKLHRRPGTGGSGELVLQNGRQAGARRQLVAPATFVGRTQGCEVRLNVDGVDPLHCVVISGPDGPILRDLNSLHGTFVNGSRTDQHALQNGDLVKVGPFQFRFEAASATAQPEPLDTTSTDEIRESLRIQAAAIAAQQIALEEEESRLEKRTAALHQQEEQLAAHLAEKQRQVQLWSDYTKAERESLRKEKLEHEKKMAEAQAELTQAQEDLERSKQKLDHEKQHINKVYQRLRTRWQKQWGTQREKYARLAEQMEAKAKAFADDREDLRDREASLAKEVIAFNTHRELSVREIQDGRDTLKKDQESWRRRRSLEFAALNARRQELEETQGKITQAGQLLLQEKEAWTQQIQTLQAELHGVNNRINHQRLRIREYEEKLAQLDAEWRKRRQPGETLAKGKDSPEVEVEILSDEPPAVAMPDEVQRRCADLDRLAAELADQRVLLTEQYRRMAEIQQTWQEERSRAAADLEALALRLASDEQSLLERQQATQTGEAQLQQRQAEIEAIREEILVWRAQLSAREKTLQEEHDREMLDLHQKDELLREQLNHLTQLRLRWNRRRQEEIELLQADRDLLARERQETQVQRVELFGRNQKLTEEKRQIAEKALALEQYRQEVFLRAKDPAAVRRVERLRRRWLSLNSNLIGNAKSERDHALKELARLDESRTQLLDQIARLTQEQVTLAEKESLLDEREAALRAQEGRLELELRKLEESRGPAELAVTQDAEAIAQEVYDDQPPPLRAA